MKTPTLSVVMSVYNTKKYLAEAIDSILQQTFKDFEFVIIDDGSTDGSTKIIDYFAARDSRIKVIKQKNQGLVYSLNKAVKATRGELIARMDADDVSEKNRLKLQINEFINNSGLVILGTGFTNIGPNGSKLRSSEYSSSLSYSDEDIKRELFVRCPFAHGSVMFNKKAAIRAGLYRDNVGPTEDYDLWIRLRKKGDYKNLPQKLFMYRVLETSVSNTHSDSQRGFTVKLIEDLWSVESPKVVSGWELYKALRALPQEEKDNFIHTQNCIMSYSKKYRYKKLLLAQKRFFVLVAGGSKAASIKKRLIKK